LKPKEVFVIKDGVLEMRPIPSRFNNVDDYLHSIFQIQCVSNCEIRELESEFVVCSGKTKYIRGKYLIWFMVEFVKTIHESIEKYSDFVKVPPKVHLSIGASNALSIVATRAKIPQTLRVFFLGTAQKYAEYNRGSWFCKVGYLLSCFQMIKGARPEN